MDRIVHVLLGDLPTVLDAVIKTSALFLTAAQLFRFTERRELAEFAPFDWIAAVAAGAIVGRAATASDTSWLAATAALLCLLATHAVLARLRFVPVLQRLIDPPLQVLIRDGHVDRRALRGGCSPRAAVATRTACNGIRDVNCRLLRDRGDHGLAELILN